MKIINPFLLITTIIIVKLQSHPVPKHEGHEHEDPEDDDDGGDDDYESSTSTSEWESSTSTSELTTVDNESSTSFSSDYQSSTTSSEGTSSQSQSVSTCDSFVLQRFLEAPIFGDITLSCVPLFVDVAGLETCASTHLSDFGIHSENLPCWPCIVTLFTAVAQFPPWDQETCIGDPEGLACIEILAAPLNEFETCAGGPIVIADPTPARQSTTPYLSALVLAFMYLN